MVTHYHWPACFETRIEIRATNCQGYLHAAEMGYPVITSNNFRPDLVHIHVFDRLFSDEICSSDGRLPFKMSSDLLVQIE